MDKLPTVGQKSSVKWKNLDYTIVDNSKEDTWVVCGPSGAYADACKYMGWCQSTQVLVVSFLKWTKWYNEARFTKSFVKPPEPVFIGDNYAAANQVADELNKPVALS